MSRAPEHNQNLLAQDAQRVMRIVRRVESDESIPAKPKEEVIATCKKLVEQLMRLPNGSGARG